MFRAVQRVSWLVDPATFVRQSNSALARASSLPQNDTNKEFTTFKCASLNTEQIWHVSVYCKLAS